MHNVPAEKLALLPSGISSEQAAAACKKGLMVFYPLSQTYEIKSNEIFCSMRQPMASGVHRLLVAESAWREKIGTVENMPERVAALTHGNKVSVVLGRLHRLPTPSGLMVSFGNSSEPIYRRQSGDLESEGLTVRHTPRSTIVSPTSQALSSPPMSCSAWLPAG
ncbi:MAG: Quinone oxidoreductase 1 [Sodalis sp.]|nr:MAG: Quinone oxidoreductase 1 [Sodalis sp.]